VTGNDGDGEWRRVVEVVTSDMQGAANSDGWQATRKKKKRKERK